MISLYYIYSSKRSFFYYLIKISYGAVVSPTLNIDRFPAEPAVNPSKILIPIGVEFNIYICILSSIIYILNAIERVPLPSIVMSAHTI